MNWEEHRLQVACVRWFRHQYNHLAKLLYAVPNGGNRNPREAARLKAEGVMPGVSDLCLDVARGGFHGLRIEMKTPKGRQSPEQKLWQTETEKQGYKYVICRGVDEFISLVNNYLTL